MPNVVRKFIRLAPGRRVLLVRAVLTLAAARLATWMLPFATGRRLLTRTKATAPTGPIGPTREQIRWAIMHARRVVPGATCLPQALTAESLLLRSGLPSQLHIGVRKAADDGLEAHAWVESDGRIVIGDLPGGLATYSRLPALPDVWPDRRSAARG